MVRYCYIAEPNEGDFKYISYDMKWYESIHRSVDIVMCLSDEYIPRSILQN